MFQVFAKLSVPCTMWQGVSSFDPLEHTLLAANKNFGEILTNRRKKNVEISTNVVG